MLREEIKEKRCFKRKLQIWAGFILFGFIYISCAYASTPIWGTFKTKDGKELRTIFYGVPKNNTHPLTIVFLQGRASFIEKYQNVLEKLNAMGYRVWSFDWRGQGGSPHFSMSQPHKLHVTTFDIYLDDLNALMQQKIRPETAGPIVLIGYSFGGHFALRYLENQPGTVQGAILVSPLLEVFTPPFPRFLADSLSDIACWLGFSESYAFGYGDFDHSEDFFEGNKRTHDRHKFDRQKEIDLSHPQLITAGITFGWAKALFDSLKKQNNPLSLKKVNVPVLVLEGQKDRMVDHSKNKRLEKAISSLKRKEYEEAYHSLFIERDDIENKLWRDIQGFLQNKF